MSILDFIIFIIIDSIIHYFLVKWEVKTNKDLFIDLEVRPIFNRKGEEKKERKETTYR